MFREPGTLGNDLEKIKKPDFISPVPFPRERVWMNSVFPVLGVIDTGSHHHQEEDQSGSWKGNPLLTLANTYILLWLPSELSRQGFLFFFFLFLDISVEE